MGQPNVGTLYDHGNISTCISLFYNTEIFPYMLDSILKCVRWNAKERKGKRRPILFLLVELVGAIGQVHVLLPFPRLWRRKTLLYKFVRNLPQAIGIATAISPKTKNGNGPTPPWAITSQDHELVHL